MDAPQQPQTHVVGKLSLADLLRQSCALNSDDFVVDDSKGLKRPFAEGESNPPSVDTASNPGVYPPASDAATTANGKQSGSHMRRKNARRRDAGSTGGAVSPFLAASHLRKAVPYGADADLTSLPVSSCGCHGTAERKPRAGKVYRVDEMRDMGWKEIQWDGMYVRCSVLQT